MLAIPQQDNLGNLESPCHQDNNPTALKLTDWRSPSNSKCSFDAVKLRRKLGRVRVIKRVKALADSAESENENLSSGLG